MHQSSARSRPPACRARWFDAGFQGRPEAKESGQVTLIDTSIWVGHFRKGDPILERLLDQNLAGVHPFVIGELACGNLRNRQAVLSDFAKLPAVALARESEVHHVLETHRLWGTGLGWVDLHLLAAAMLAGWELLTSDPAMKAAAVRLRITRAS